MECGIASHIAHPMSDFRSRGNCRAERILPPQETPERRAHMRHKLFRFVAVALVTAGGLATPGLARAQWIEQLVGGWAFYAFGSCPIFGCFTGPHLCAQVTAITGVSWCYES